MARIGYARVSTSDQTTENQEIKLRKDGCTRIYTDHGVSGAKASRPEWDKCLERLEAGDVLVVTKLDRMGRSTKNLLEVVETLKSRGADLVILDQNIDTTTAMGECFFTVMAAFATFERQIIVERTNDGLARARANGGGVPPGRTREYTDVQVKLAKQMKSEGTKADTIAQALGVSRATVYRMLKEA